MIVGDRNAEEVRKMCERQDICAKLRVCASACEKNKALGCG